MGRRLLRDCLLVLVSSIVLATPSWSDIIGDVEAFLDGIGAPVPDGWDVEFGSLPGGKPAQAQPDPDGGGTITVDPENIADMAGNPPVDAPQAGAAVAIAVYHEMKHIDGSYGRGECHEINLQGHVAQKHCELICFMDNNGFDIDALCALYDGLADCFNTGCNPPGSGGASDVWAAKRCQQPGGSKDYPGDIPPCECCT